MSELRMAYLVGRVDRLLRAMMEEALEHVGLTVNELTALSVLADQPGLSNARLARRSLVSPQAMHKVISALEDRDLVVRAEAAEGGRSRGVSVTTAALSVLAEVGPVLDGIEADLTRDLSADDAVSLAKSLRTIARL